jgi:thiol-disulfide isomerase/thioredoxin
MHLAFRSVRTRVLAAACIVAAIGSLIAYQAVWLSPPRREGRQAAAPADTPSAPQTRIGLSVFEHPRDLPVIRFSDADGRKLTLAEFRGKTVLLNIWATWCVPCRKEMPTLDRLQARLGGADFQVVALSIDRKGLSVVAPFYRRLGLKALGIYVDETGQAASALGSVGIPTTLLIDKTGREIARKLGPAEWDSPETTALIRRNLASGANAKKRAGR